MTRIGSARRRPIWRRKRSTLEQGPQLVGGSPAVHELGRTLEHGGAAAWNGVPVDLALQPEPVLDDRLHSAHVGEALDAVRAADARLLGAAERQPAHAVGDEAVVDAHVARLQLPG